MNDTEFLRRTLRIHQNHIKRLSEVLVWIEETMGEAELNDEIPTITSTVLREKRMNLITQLLLDSNQLAGEILDALDD